MSIILTIVQGTGHADVEKIILEEYEKLKTDFISEDELAAKKAQIRANLAFS